MKEIFKEFFEEMDFGVWWHFVWNFLGSTIGVYLFLDLNTKFQNYVMILLLLIFLTLTDIFTEIRKNEG